MQDLLARLRRTGALFVVGFIVILFIAFGIIYLQQGVSRTNLQNQILKLSLTLAKPFPSADTLKTEYSDVNAALAPVPIKTLLDTIVNTAKLSGLDVKPSSQNFSIPAQNSTGKQKVGDGNYDLLSFRGIKAQGKDSVVMAFISDLETGKALKNLAVKGVPLSQVEVKVREEEARMNEFNSVVNAVQAMMNDNNITAIPNPLKYDDGNAYKLMGDLPETSTTIEGFPDTATTVWANGKGYTGTGAPRDGYVLYKHDKVDPTDTNKYTTVNYIDSLITGYYYTCEADGTVRQFDGPTVSSARELLYLKDIPTTIETLAMIDVDIYFKAPVATTPAKPGAK